MDLILDMANRIHSEQPELTLDECIDIASDVSYERGAWNDFDLDDIEHEAYKY
jgi:hypothetical protein